MEGKRLLDEEATRVQTGITHSDILAPGDRLGSYELQEPLASGGCGRVYRAKDTKSGQDIAVKVMHSDLGLSPELGARFRQEVEIVEALRHPNIVTIFEHGNTRNGLPYYGMELLTGESLDKIIKARGRMTPAEVVEILTPVCEALEAAHTRGIIHRDIKCQNIMVTSWSPVKVKLLDFGIAKFIETADGRPGLTQQGRVLGTPSAMAPEQFRGGPVDRCTDIYALGVVLYQLLTGQLPFRGKTLDEIQHHHLNVPPPSPSTTVPVDPALDAVVLKCLQKERSARYASASEFVRALREAVDKSTSSQPRSDGLGVAIHVELALAPEEETDDALDAVDLALELVEQRLTDGGYGVGLKTPNAVMGARVLDGPPASDIRAAETLAKALFGELQQATAAAPNLRMRIVVHAAGASRKQQGEQWIIAGGELLKVAAWVPYDRFGLIVTTGAHQLLSA